MGDKSPHKLSPDALRALRAVLKAGPKGIIAQDLGWTEERLKRAIEEIEGKKDQVH